MAFVDMLMPRFQWDIMSRCLVAWRWRFALFLLVTLMAAACTVAGPLILAYGILQVSRSAVVFAGWCFVAFAAVVACGRVLQDVKAVLVNQFEQNVRNLASVTTLDALLNAPTSLFSSVNPSKVSALLGGLHRSNKTYIQTYMMALLGGAVDIMLSFIVIGSSISWFVASSVLVYGSMIVWLTLLGNRRSGNFLKVAQESSHEGANLLGNILANVVSIRVCGGQRWSAGTYARLVQASRIEWMKLYLVRLRFGTIQSLLLFVQYSSVFVVLLWIHRDAGEVHEFVMVGMLLLQLNRPFEVLGLAIRDLAVARGTAEPIGEVMKGPGDPLKPAAVGRLMTSTGLVPVSVRGLSFSYQSVSGVVLSDVTADFGPGAINFVVGPSGSGKSTLMQVVLGINSNYEGSVSIAGMERRDIDDASYFEAVGYVPQEPRGRQSRGE
jgi:ATP-binding cassette subfamily B protein